MFRLPAPLCNGARRHLWIAVATVAVLLVAAAPVQAGPSAYVTDGHNVHQYDIVAGGLLVPMDPATVAAGDSPIAVAVSPDFKSLYATNQDSGTVSQYDIGRDGALSPKSPAMVDAGYRPSGVAVSPNGQSVYVTSYMYLLQYDVGSSGELLPKSPPRGWSGPGDWPAMVFPFGVAVSPDSQSVYVADKESYDIAQFDVGPRGLLSAKSPPTATAGLYEFPYGIAVSPDGQSVYVTILDGGKYDHNVAQFDVGPGGTLSPKSPPTVASGNHAWPNATAVAVSPDSESVYVTNYGGPYDEPASDPSVSQYHVGAGGLLAPMTPATAAVGEGPTGVAVSPDGQSVYVANRVSGSVSQYDVGESGKLSPKNPAEVDSGTGGGAVGVAVSPGLVPTTKKQCKDGGWRQWGFREPGRCIPFVSRNARHSCFVARKVIGRHAFHKEYGKGKHHRRAWRRCIKRTVRGR
jgi:DNA-binding beta-propeller fold protein YncE